MNNEDKITVALVEDKPELQKSISERLSLFDNIELLFVANNGEHAIQKLDFEQPQVMLMDIEMPVMNGIDATRQIKAKFPDIKIVMSTVFEDSDNILQALIAGATGYLLKDTKPARLLMAIEDAIEGGAPMTPKIASKALEIIKKSNKAAPSKPLEEELTEREIEMIEGISDGLSYKEIAAKHFISTKTVSKHIENIYRKLDVHSKMEAVNKAKNHGLLSIFL